MRLLIAEDDPIAMALLTELLVSAGHEVSCAPDGQCALELLGQQEFQVVITDWEMPKLNGLELCQAVRRGASASVGYVYIILLTSHGATAERVRGLTAGADDFMTKPFEPGELLARI